jgi:type IX secretion system PorP/SprF family membrane protein
MMRKHLLLLLFVVSFVQIHAQDPIFSQFFAAPLHLNPAFAGVSHAPRFLLNHRNQWPSWPNAYQTYAIAYEQALPFLNSGIGASITADDAGNGIYQTRQLSLFYSYQIKANDDLALKFGIEAGAFRSQLAWDKLVFGDQLDPVNGLGSTGKGNSTEETRPGNLGNNQLDFSAGILAFSKKFYGGISLQHLNNFNENLLNTGSTALLVGHPLRFSVHGGAQFDLGGNGRNGHASFFAPNALFVNQAGFSQLMLGGYLGFGPVFAGAWYRNSGKNPDAVIGLIGYRYGVLRIGYSYDVTLSNLSLSRTGGSHEISLSFTLDESRANQRRRKKVNINDCFQIFR